MGTSEGKNVKTALNEKNKPEKQKRMNCWRESEGRGGARRGGAGRGETDAPAGSEMLQWRLKYIKKEKNSENENENNVDRKP